MSRFDAIRAAILSDIAGGHKEGQAVCGISGELLTQQAQCAFERRNVALDGSPQDIEVNEEIAMNETISHSRPIAPRNLWMLLAIIFRYLTGGFAENLETPNDRVLSHTI